MQKVIDGEPLDLTFVILAFNEEVCLRACVEDCITWMKSAKRVVPVLIMDDGSKDRTAEIADELAAEYANVRAHHMPKNVGQYHLIRMAWTLVETTYYVAVPGDDQFDMRSFDMFVPHIGRYDILLGFPNNEEVRGRLRSLLSAVWRIYLLNLYGIAMVYLGGLIVLPVDLARRVEIESQGFLGWYEFMVRLVLSGATVLQIPFVMRERAGGKTTAFNPTRNVRDLVKMAFVWSRIKGPGSLPAGKDWERVREVYREYQAAKSAKAK